MTNRTGTQANPVAATAPQRPRPNGGYNERPAAVRPAAPRPAERANPTDRTDPADPAAAVTVSPVCPACGKAMMLRTARKGPKPGSQFWGCTGFPECRKTLAVQA